MESFFDAARYFTQNSRCTLIGSLCLYMLAPDILGREVHDVDLFAHGSEDNLRRIISLMEDGGFEVFSWQDRIDRYVPLSLLRGRYYLRGIRGGLIVDVTYEKDSLSYEEMEQYEIIRDGIRLYCRKGLIRILEDSDREENLRHAQMLRKLKED